VYVFRECGKVLVETFDDVLPPLDQEPYYAIQKMDEVQAWQAFEDFRIEGIWFIPDDFSKRIESGTHPEINIHFMNYNDDQAKNHRIYSAEVLWHFYQNIS
jgi:hypothetical protein